MAGMSYAIDHIPDIIAWDVLKLSNIGIDTTHELLLRCNTVKGRHKTSLKTQITERMLLTYVNAADMMRIPTIGSGSCRLMKRYELVTVKDLAFRNPHNLCDGLNELNKRLKLLDRDIPIQFVERWVESAKEMETIISY